MSLFDCSNLDTAIASVARAYRCSPMVIQEFSASFAVDTCVEAGNESGGGNDLVQAKFESFLQRTPIPSEHVCWFHLTRTLESANFEDGIEPLNRARQRIWETLFQVFAGTVHQSRLKEMQSNRVESQQYNCKLSRDCDQGPFAMLVREAAFSPSELTNVCLLYPSRCV